MLPPYTITTTTTTTTYYQHIGHMVQPARPVLFLAGPGELRPLCARRAAPGRVDACTPSVVVGGGW